VLRSYRQVILEGETVSGQKHSTLPWWVSTIALAGAALLTLGGILALVNPAMLVGRAAEIDAAARVYAGYLVSRNLAVAAMLGAWIIRARAVLSGALLLTAMIQFLDVRLTPRSAK
jgi:hypothetical protein